MVDHIIYSTFISGLSSVVEGFIKSLLPDAKVLYLLDGAIVYRTASSLNTIKKLELFNNSFHVLHIATGHAKEVDFNIAITDILSSENISAQIKFEINNFKLFFYNNQFVSVALDQRNHLENFIKRRFNLRNERSAQSFNEFWLLKRSENLCFFLLRITEERAKLGKGELKPELAYILCLLSEPSSNDVFIDPFAGSGAIPLERMKQPYSKIFISDIDKKNIYRINDRIRKLKKHIDIYARKGNFLLSSYGESEFNKIVTDPPWGTYDRIENIQHFYLEIFAKFASYLASGGILIILVERHIQIEDLLIYYQDDFECIARYEILLSGRKATIYKIQKL